jgi:hypothetical protein
LSEEFSTITSENHSISEAIAISVKASNTVSLSESTAIFNHSESTIIRVTSSEEISTSKSQSLSEFTSDFDSTLTSLHQSEVTSERKAKNSTVRIKKLTETNVSNELDRKTIVTSFGTTDNVDSEALLPNTAVKVITARRILIGQYETGDKFNIRLILEILTPLILISGFLLAAKRRKKEDDAETK